MPTQRIVTQKRYRNTYFLDRFKDQTGWRLSAAERLQEPKPVLTYHLKWAENDPVVPVMTWWWDMGCTTSASYALMGTLVSRNENKARIRAYAKFKDKAYETAQLGLFIAERKEAIKLMANRGKDLAVGLSYLLRGRFRGFLKHFNIQPLPKHRRKLRNRPKQAAGLWLEYWLGWAPMVGDIQAALEVLDSEYPENIKVVGSGSVRDTLKASSATGQYAWDLQGLVRVRYQARVRVTNPNLFRANQLGLINWVATGVEMIPFSFVLNWFVNLQDWCNYWSDWLGLELLEPFTSQRSTLWGHDEQFSPEYGRWKCKTTFFSRTLGVSTPELGWRKYDGLSITRLATTASLLVSLFTKASYAAGLSGR